MIHIHWTSPSLEEARTIVRLLLEKRLIACASFFPIHSMFLWKGAIEESAEVKVILKTEESLFADIVALIEENTSYEVPEIVQVTVSESAKPYQEWLASCLFSQKRDNEKR